MPVIERVALGFGSNLGNRINNLKAAIKEISLNNGFSLLRLSSVYETEPWGCRNQNNFLNMCGIFLCRYQPLKAFEIIKQAELKLGRQYRGKWKAREIDIDLLFFGNRIINNRKLVIPHPFIRERNFVLKPLVEIIPGFIHPVFKKSINRLYRESPDTGKAEIFKKL